MAEEYDDKQGALPRPEGLADVTVRVVAVGGETVESRGGRVFVNGLPLSEPYLAPGTTTPAFESSAFPTQCIRVPKGDVFVLGDNRNNSAASNRFGPISENLIVGPAFIRVWPLSSAGGL